MVAPAQALDKAVDSFEDTWSVHSDKLLVRLGRRVDAAIALVQQTLIESRSSSTAS